MSVAFQLTCLARIGTHDWFYKVTGSDSGLNVSGTPDLASSFSVASTLVLFLTLLIFTGPFVNTYLMAVDYLIISKKFRFFDSKDDGWKKGLAYFITILCAHIAGAFTAAAIVKEAKDKAYLTWEIPKVANVDENKWGPIIEETIAVCSLLVGFLYLKSMDDSKKERKAVEIEARNESEKKSVGQVMPYVPMKFIMRLTLLVACVCRAFPDAHLSPHVSIYKASMGLDETYGFRILGGCIGCVITFIWWYLRLRYTNLLYAWDKNNKKHSQQGSLEEKQGLNPADTEAAVSSISLPPSGAITSGPSGSNARMHPSGLRISLADSRYF